MVIGGEEVFRAVLPQAGRIYLTEVKAAPDADTWFPAFDRREWREASREAHPAGPKDDHAFSFVVLDRKTSSAARGKPNPTRQNRRRDAGSKGNFPCIAPPE